MRTPYAFTIASIAGAFLALTAAGMSSAQWLLEPIAEGDSPYLAIDAQARPHITLWREFPIFPIGTRTEFQYARKEGGSWFVEVIEDSAVNASAAAITVDSNDEPGIAIGSLSAPRLRFVRRSGASWTFETIDSLATVAANSTGRAVAATFDAGDNPFVAYFTGGATKTVHVASRSGAQWTSEAIAAAGSGFFNWHQASLAITSGGEPAVAFNIFAFAAYARKSGASWSVENLPTPGTGISLALDAFDVPHVSYVRADSAWLVYATKVGGLWTVERVGAESVPPNGTTTWLTLSSDGVPHIAYRHVPDVRYATRSGGSWSITILGDAEMPLIAMDRTTYAPREFPRIVLDVTDGLVNYAYPDPTPVVGPPNVSSQIFLSAVPNPALDGRMRVTYRVPGSGRFALGVFDLAGRRVRTLAAGDDAQGADGASIAWDGRDESGRPVASGPYFLRLDGDGASTTQRVMLIR